MATTLEQLVAALGTAWCPTCRTRVSVVEVHDEPGNPDPSGRCDVYTVTDLACGHSVAAVVAGASDWTL